ncbi:leucine--tRNA ligase [Haladaptatus paucihalophilus]|uniref:Leucine--tRNA ligase n=2 Tax=Haladaptatus paucihalophilus DX253 TaxID=797209 RepID=A0A1M7BM62_HALPU|nr:leucine--tRNA ligase [Haladaptatus paucihalophilus]SHL55946.1 leucyl-tRNA synthetase [Haladaptatus paucihalophilus DX253]
MSDYEPREIESKWQSRWAEDGRYEVDPSQSEATFVTVPYPYPSGGMHIGHARTYTVPDVWARYRRLQGDNVLFPIAWHVTGTPIVGAVERLKKREPEQMSVLQDTYNVSDEDLSEMETPMGFARHFIEDSYKKNMQSLGLSIDWRREFTTNDERYSKFITWQYETLKERGLLEKGLHPVKYCTNEGNPVTTHDLLEGEEAEFQEYTLVKFGWDDEAQRASESASSAERRSANRSSGERSEPRAITVPMATLRPETVHGVTNAYIDPDAEYVEAAVDGETWLVSESAAEKLELQAHDVEIRDHFSGERLVGEHVTNPVTGDDVLVLPASFVDADNATGVVMSVPAHSPDDWVALQEAKSAARRAAEQSSGQSPRDAADARMEAYGIDPEEVAAIEPKAIIDVEGYGEFPAEDAVVEHGIEDSSDPALEDATQEVYNREFHSGKLRGMYDDYAGEIVEDVRDDLKAEFQEQGSFDTMHEFSEEVVCRCGGAVEVAEQDTWFLRYNDEAWKAKAHEVVAELDAIPENTREQYDHTIDWLNEWPCIRNYGLGTRLPWDDEFVIEPLSDSTIYMSYYTIAHRISDVPVEELDKEFFDTLFYGSEAVDDPNETALALREEWDYWYPVDYRCSANDLVSNHLTFFLFHHAELFDPANWPQGITVMGMGLLEGEKMSSSKGHVVLPENAIEKYGADTVRFFLMNSAEPWQDYDWRSEQVESTGNQLRRFWNRANEIISAPEGERDLQRIDRWLLSKLQGTVREVTDAMDRFETRTASQDAFYGFEEHLKWYRKRTDTDRSGARWTLRTVLNARLRLLAPFIPFMATELHERLTGNPIAEAEWPDVDSDFESTVTEIEESLVEGLTDDVRDIVNVTDTDPETIRVYVAADWKRHVLAAVVDTGPNVGAVMGEVMQDEELREKGDEVNQLVQKLVEDVRERPDEQVAVLADLNEVEVYEDARDFFEREFEADVEVYREGADVPDPEDKARHAAPLRPAIHLEG